MRCSSTCDVFMAAVMQPPFKFSLLQITLDISPKNIKKLLQWIHTGIRTMICSINATTQTQQGFPSQSDIPGSMAFCINSHHTPCIWSGSACMNLLLWYGPWTCTGDTLSREHQPSWGDEGLHHLPCQIHIPTFHSLWEESTYLYHSLWLVRIIKQEYWF